MPAQRATHTPSGIPIPKGQFFAYGALWDEKIYYHPYKVELALFGDSRLPMHRGNENPGRIGHFRNFVDCFWGEHNKRKSFIWHPWSEQLITEACLTKELTIGGCSGSGKCLHPDTLVLMFSGETKRAGDIVIGDQIMGDDSTPRNVLDTFTGRSNLVKVTPRRGDPFICNDDHMLTLKRVYAGPSSQGKLGKIYDVPVKEYLKKGVSFKLRHKMFSVGVEFPEQPIELDPRMYGLWLGNGNKHGPLITSPYKEAEVNTYMCNWAAQNGFNVNQSFNTTSECPTWSFSMNGKRGNPFNVVIHESTAREKHKDKPNSKRILSRYLYNSRAVRMELLAGLLDADGYAANETYFEIACSYPELAKDIIYLARSLGFCTSAKEKKIKLNGKDFRTCRINILGEVWKIPTLRKKCRQKIRDNPMNTAFKIEQLGVGDWAGFTVDGNHRFLLGDFTVTHNSLCGAPWAIGNWLMDPMNTIVVVVSTTVTGAKRRIWGYIEEFFNAIPVPVPGKLQASYNQIVPFDGKKVISQRTGIFLVAGEKGSEKESSDKILGFHAKRVILILDELPDLSMAIVNTAISNLRQNPYFQIIGLGNPCDYFDPFSMLAEPFEGWQNVDVDRERWKTKNGGTFLHFDSTKSPNILKGRTIYPFLPKIEDYNEAQRNLGENSLLFWRQWRGFWPPEGAEDAIYSQAEIVRYNANLSDVEWAVNGNSPRYIPMPQTSSQNIPYAPVTVAFLDLGLVNGGDRCILYFCKFGKDKHGKPKILFYKYVHLVESVADRVNPREVQIVQAFRRECEKEGVHPSCVGFDASGGGIPYQGFVTTLWSREVVPIQFGGAPSDLPVSDTDKTPCKNKYVNKVTEIWFSAKWLMRSDMIRGLSKECIDEMVKRKYDTNQGVDLKLRAEPKAKMKSRMGKSCDISDAAFGCIMLIRQKFRFNASNANAATVSQGKTWKGFVKQHSKKQSGFDTGYSGMKRGLDYSRG